ncbi:MAG: hypothetical protein CM1200mP4_4480 [Rhodospirillaceae bacterium]|nr:MAG: hypothetical protein CM1200mP4_4480 [Rhodospirillaceae bacterium]
MMEGGFITASANVDKLEPEAADMPLVVELKEAWILRQLCLTVLDLVGQMCRLPFSPFETS